MSIVNLSGLGLSFGAFDVFKNITASVPNDGKIGLIGPNGIGKTSLLLILAGLSTPSTGSVHLARGKRLGYLRQEAVEAFADRANTVWAEMLSVFEALQALEAELRALEARMVGGDHSPEILAEYGEKQAAFEHAGGYDYEVRIKQTLEGLGFDKALHATPIKQLSGGQKTRALLARLLLEQPDLLILDEPTNHLDTEAVEWLENTLHDWPGALLVVSHDRYFLDNVVNTIWEMSRVSMEVYRGNYSAYLTQRDERQERLLQIFEEEKARLQKEIDFVVRNIARQSTNARAVGLLKRVHRDLFLIEHLGIQALRSGKSWAESGIAHLTPASVINAEEALRQINALQPPVVGRHARLGVRLKIGQRSGDIVLRTFGLKVGYAAKKDDAGKSLFTAPDLTLMRGECAAIIGPNGAGKTTFLKTLLSKLEPLAGESKLGASLKVGYFAQAQDALHGDSTVMEELQRHQYMSPGAARNYLAQYLFRGEDVFKPVEALSGGERARLALALLALDGANLLLLDEPTNHLDIPAQEVLQEVLENYEGTILLVSHDRYLIDRLATQIWEVRHGQMTLFTGTWREMVAARTNSTVAQVGRGAEPKRANAEAAPPPKISAVKPTPKTDKESKRRAKMLAELEEKIALKEVEVGALADMLQATNGDAKRARVVSEEFAYAQRELEELMGEWEKISKT
ncbi:MAG: ABC-F family ATP-binding cassette domain-containing protein [Anaerolineales bacterium]|nr:ABC-F family ATP-binding cassette domain-containing protein [Anaerolineales bacterium]